MISSFLWFYHTKSATPLQYTLKQTSMFLSPISETADDIQIILPLIDHRINGHCLFMFIHLVKNKVFLCDENKVLRN